MEALLELIPAITEGGTSALIAFLIVSNGVLIYYIRDLSKKLSDSNQSNLSSKDSEIDSLKEIIDKYHQGNIDLIHALNEIKIVLVTIQSSRSRK